MSPNQEIDNFLHPRSPYHGKVKPENLVFNANLQEFSQKVGYICNLETAGKIDTKDAYKKIKDHVLLVCLVVCQIVSCWLITVLYILKA